MTKKKLFGIFVAQKASARLRQLANGGIILWAIIFLLGLGLRLYPGSDHFSWIYDQARDAYVSRGVITNNDFKLVGPQTDYPGLNHGPLVYYVLAPVYFISQGDPNLPGLVMILINLSTIIPLYLLVKTLFKDKKITWIALFLFAISYEQVEYARWIFNFSLSIPLLTWSYYFLWQGLKKNITQIIWAGVFLGLAIQGQFFLIYLIPFFLGFIYWLNKPKLGHLITKYGIRFTLGLSLGLLPMILAEVKFGFIGIKTFFTQFLARHNGEVILASKAVTQYLDHLAVTAKHNGLGLSYAMGLYFLVILLVAAVWLLLKSKSKEVSQSIMFLLILFFSHGLLFAFHQPNKVFVDITLGIPLLILMAFVLGSLFNFKKQLMGTGLLVMITFFSLRSLKTNVTAQSPLGLYNYIQTGMLFSQKMEIADEMYHLAGTDEPFSLSVLGTPYGVRTVWASVFEQYQRRNNVPVPYWHGFVANGYVGEELLQVTDHPSANHILLIESEQTLIDKFIRDKHLKHQNQVSELVVEKELYGYRIQLRKPIVTIKD